MAAFLRVCLPLLAGAASGITLQPNVSREDTVETSVTPAEQIEQIRLRMQASPKDSAVQRDGCRALQALADTQRGAPGPWGGRQVSTTLLNAGIGVPLAEGLLNAVAIAAARGLRVPDEASRTCFFSINGLIVQNDYNKSLALISTAPRLWHAIVAFFRAFKGSSIADVSLCTFAGLFGTPQPSLAAKLEVEAGGIDYVMEYLKDESLKSDPAMFQRVYCALSDPVHESSGVVARAIANHGGPLNGIKLLVRSLRWAKESRSTFHEGNGFGLLYEGVHDVGGVLEHDDANHTFAHAFLREGLVDELVPIMREEPGDRLLQDMSCEAIKWITDDNYDAQQQLVEVGALELMALALKKWSHPPYLGYGAVTIACSTALLNFAANNQMWRERLNRLGVLDTLDEEVLAAFPAAGKDDFIMRTRWFPNSNIYKLRNVLLPFA